MQGNIVPFYVQEKLAETQVAAQENEDALDTDFDVLGMAGRIAGYLDCMEEAIKYLVNVEHYPQNHPAVDGLRKHLHECRQEFLRNTLKSEKESS